MAGTTRGRRTNRQALEEAKAASEAETVPEDTPKAEEPVETSSDAPEKVETAEEDTKDAETSTTPEADQEEEKDSSEKETSEAPKDTKDEVTVKVVSTGLTVGGNMLVAGAEVTTSEDWAKLSKDEQVKKFGQHFYDKA